MGEARAAALEWTRRITKGYKGVKIDDLLKSFQDGLAFCALVHYHLPEKEKYRIPFDLLVVNTQEDKEKNLKLAFDVAKQVFSIPDIIEVEDVGLEQLSMLTAINHYRQHLSKKIHVSIEPPKTDISTPDSSEMSPEGKAVYEKLKQKEREHEGLLAKFAQREEQHAFVLQKLRESESKHDSFLKSLQEREQKEQEITDNIKIKQTEQEAAIAQLKEKEMKQQELIKQLLEQEAKQEEIIEQIRNQEKIIKGQPIKLPVSNSNSSSDQLSALSKQISDLFNRISVLETTTADLKKQITTIELGSSKVTKKPDSSSGSTTLLFFTSFVTLILLAHAVYKYIYNV